MSFRPSGVSSRIGFAGRVAKATPNTDGLIDIKAFGANALTEDYADVFVASGVPPNEIAYTLARSAGMSDENLAIEGLQELPYEVFEILVPLAGISVDTKAEVAGIHLLGHEGLVKMTRELELQTDGLPDAECFALCLQTARLMFNAEQGALDKLEFALAWLATFNRYGLTHLPSGALRTFTRENARAVPRHLGYALVRGVVSGRSWLRSIGSTAGPDRVRVDSADPLLAAADSTTPTTQREAIRACLRASAGRDPLARVQALWEAVEYAVAGQSAPRQFTKHEIEAIRSSLPADLASDLSQRMNDLLGQLTSPPLLTRVRTLIETVGIPFSDSEFELLRGLRAVRNDALHGREPELPSAEVLDHATALVCRLVVFRVATSKAPSSSGSPQPPRGG